ncbi:MAG: T9SS type A sorting domain-containing protein, partial [Bacteroidales bacterium]|nr:T9SS type A sorting domain-containing protein [Bacteroidales bacterium]
DANYMELSEVINQRNQLLLLDQSRVTSISFYHIEPPAPYMLPLSEIAYMQSYPWGQYGDNIDLDYSNFMFRNHVLACQNENVLPVATPQTYSWENETYPSPTHIDCQTYLAFITGMKGVIYYTFKDYDNNSNIDITQPEIFAAAAKVAEEVLQTEWQSVILHGTHSYTNIGQYRYYANWLHENALYVMAVNASADDSYHFEIPLPEDAAYEAVNFFDYRPDSLSIENKVLQGELAPYQVAIYKIALSTSTPEITQQLTAQLMPNPADNSFQLSGIDAPTAVSIFNAQGSFVHRQHIARAGERIDIGFLKSGVYFVRFRSIDSGLSQTLKLIKL